MILSNTIFRFSYHFLLAQTTKVPRAVEERKRWSPLVMEADTKLSRSIIAEIHNYDSSSQNMSIWTVNKALGFINYFFWLLLIECFQLFTPCRSDSLFCLFSNWSHVGWAGGGGGLWVLASEKEKIVWEHLQYLIHTKILEVLDVQKF